MKKLILLSIFITSGIGFADTAAIDAASQQIETTLKGLDIPHLWMPAWGDYGTMDLVKDAIRDGIKEARAVEAKGGNVSPSTLDMLMQRARDLKNEYQREHDHYIFIAGDDGTSATSENLSNILTNTQSVNNILKNQLAQTKQAKTSNKLIGKLDEANNNLAENSDLATKKSDVQADAEMCAAKANRDFAIANQKQGSLNQQIANLRQKVRLIPPAQAPRSQDELNRINDRKHDLEGEKSTLAANIAEMTRTFKDNQCDPKKAGSDASGYASCQTVINMINKQVPSFNQAITSLKNRIRLISSDFTDPKVLSDPAIKKLIADETPWKNDGPVDPIAARNAQAQFEDELSADTSKLANYEDAVGQYRDLWAKVNSVMADTNKINKTRREEHDAAIADRNRHLAGITSTLTSLDTDVKALQAQIDVEKAQDTKSADDIGRANASVQSLNTQVTELETQSQNANSIHGDCVTYAQDAYNATSLSQLVTTKSRIASAEASLSEEVARAGSRTQNASR